MPVEGFEAVTMGSAAGHSWRIPGRLDRHDILVARPTSCALGRQAMNPPERRIREVSLPGRETLLGRLK